MSFMALLVVALPLISACGGDDEEEITPMPTLEVTPTPTSTPTPLHIEMASIPGGTFGMGSTDGESDEQPFHSVALLPFSMAKYEVTYAEWMEVKSWGEAHGYSFNRPGDRGSEERGGTQDENHPVTDIEWYDAVLWCNALSEMEGRTSSYYTSSAKSTVYRSGRVSIKNDWVKWDSDGYRLPTEAEWEYACRAGTTTEYSFGNSISGSDANYRGSGDSYDNGTTPVGSYRANAWGIYDMHGNVWEWCWDRYDSRYYRSSPSNNSWGPSSGQFRVWRGGSWSYYPEDLRSANRNNINPAHDGHDIGFRPVRSQ
jgi:formylglycine-generating enzyme required for sulfatase activity